MGVAVTLTLQDRAGGFEAKHAHDHELRFRATARRDKLFARWVSTRQHLPPGEAGHLHGAVLAVADGPGHDEALLDMVREAVGAHGGGMSAADLQAGLAACAVQAWEELLAASQVTPG